MNTESFERPIQGCATGNHRRPWHFQKGSFPKFCYLSGGELLGGQEGGEAALEAVGVAADGVRGVAVVGALPVEAQVVRGRYEERLQQLAVRLLVDLGGHVEEAAGHRHRPPEAQDSGRDEIMPIVFYFYF